MLLLIALAGFTEPLRPPFQGVVGTLKKHVTQPDTFMYVLKRYRKAIALQPMNRRDSPLKGDKKKAATSSLTNAGCSRNVMMIDLLPMES